MKAKTLSSYVQFFIGLITILFALLATADVEIN